MRQSSSGVKQWVLVSALTLSSATLSSCGDPPPSDGESGGQQGASDSGGAAGDLGGSAPSGGRESDEGSGGRSSGGRASGGHGAGGRQGVGGLGGDRSAGGDEGTAGERGSGGADGVGGHSASGGHTASGGGSGSDPFECPSSVALATGEGGFGGESTAECMDDREYDALADACVTPIACNESGSPFGGGHGTEEAPFAICTLAQLRAIEGEASGSHFVLARSLDLAAAGNFAPLGHADAPFEGTFCGAGRAIARATISFPTADFVGLFAALGSTALVQNLKLLDFEVTGTEEVGTLAGRSLGNIVHVETAGVVLGDISVGGLVGHSQGSIDACSSSAQIIANPDAGYFAGGLVGRSIGSITDSSSSSMVEGRSSVGGLVGSNDGTIERSEASGFVWGSQFNVGGLVGGGEGMVLDSRASGDVEGRGLVGGLVGSVGGWDIVAYSEATGDVYAETSAGGLIGSIFRGDVLECRATGNVTATGSGFVGGLVGDSGAVIIRSVATGSVSGGGIAGGLVGSLGNQMLGGIESSYAAGDVTGGGPVGGLVGDIYWTYDRGSAIGGSFAFGLVSGGEPLGGLLGGPVPEDFGVVSSYYLEQPPVAGPGTPLTLQEFADPASFSWTFGGTWVMSEELGHPILAWEIE